MGILLLTACDAGSGEAKAPNPDGRHQALLEVLGPERTGITFNNRVIDDSLVNYFTYTYMYNGGGVAAGDLDGDGLPDLVMVSNRNSGAVYRNLGDLRFEDITARSGVDLSGTWSTGVAMADVNADGHLDIYVCASGPVEGEPRRNKLFINDGHARFTEQAQALGLADTGHSTMAYFADLDNDLDLDLFLLGHRSDWREIKRVITDPRWLPVPDQTDRVYLNDGSGRFTDHSAEAGVLSRRFGLGAGIADLNGDGRRDIYVGNDFSSADRLLINQDVSGTKASPRFTDEILDRLRHTSMFSMGVDIADMNNDGHPDICTLDMTPGDHRRNKENMASMQPTEFWNLVKNGFHHQYMVNTLQLNNGNGSFSDIGQMAGIDRTDWSWAPLFVDLDNDGWKDLYITNGIARDINNSDFRTNFRNNSQQPGAFQYNTALDLAPRSVVNNVVYRNRGDLTFEAAMEPWGYQHAVNSTGAAYADLDRDGDMDLVTVNQDAQASVVRNHCSETRKGHYVQVRLIGTTTNPYAIGTALSVHAPAGAQFNELYLSRGYQSSVEPLVHFGLADAGIDSLVIDWYDGTRSVIVAPAADQRLQVRMADTPRRPRPDRPISEPLFVERRAFAGIDHRHVENEADDLRGDVLLPHRQTEHGPAAATADVNGDGLEDVFIGAASGGVGTLFLRTKAGAFERSTDAPWSAYKASEFIGAHFLDANGDGHPDLYLAAGSTERPDAAAEYQDRLFLNDGTGRFRIAADALPAFTTSTMAVASADIDADGDLDLFVGGRNMPGAYPAPPPSHVLINAGGRFTEESKQWLGELARPGMITDARFVDVDGKAPAELVLCGEWMPLTIWRNTGRSFEDITASSLNDSLTGWWFHVHPADLDGDGDMDLVAGNLGLNNKFHPSLERPLKIYMADFEGKGRNDVVLAKSRDGVELPVRGRECSSQQCPTIAQRFPTYSAFAAAELPAIYGDEALSKAVQAQATEFRSMVWRNDGKGHFTPLPLPNAAQVSPVRGVISADVNGDGHLDLIIAGNMHGAEVETTRYDAGSGCVLLGDGALGFKPLTVGASGIYAPYDVRHLLPIRDKGSVPSVLVISNNAPVQFFGPAPNAGPGQVAAR